MPNGNFCPGFRLSIFDTMVLFLGTFGAFWFWPRAPWLGFVIAFVVGHFFLFCNIFRISRALELLWASVFIILILRTLKSHDLSWTTSAPLSLIVTVVVIGIELRKPSYHGIGWSRVNPNLREWWDANQHS